jgi:bacterial/archaeal transporter family-2 protein
LSNLLQLLALALLGIGAGASVAVQQALNGSLRTSLGSPPWAAFVSYLGGTLTILAVLLVMREPWPTPVAVTGSAAWSWTGGLFGAIFILISILLLPHFGAATVIALVVTGQMLASIGLDHFGLFGLTQHAVDLHRLAGVALLISGVVLIRH